MIGLGADQEDLLPDSLGRRIDREFLSLPCSDLLDIPDDRIGLFVVETVLADGPEFETGRDDAGDFHMLGCRGSPVCQRDFVLGGPADEAARGGIAGSSPIWGDYSRFEYPNWAAKFFADALMMDMQDCVIPPIATRIANPGEYSHG